MKFLAIYRASFYLMLTCATLVLSIDATDDNPFALYYPVAVAAASTLAFVSVDRNPKLALSRNTANWLGIATLVPSMFEWYVDDKLLLLAAAHWLVYLQLVKLFLPKTVEDDWFLFLLGLVQVLVGGVMSQSDKVGVALFAWSLLSLWVLTMFSLHREALRMKKVPMASLARVGADPSEPYRGLVDPPFLVTSLRIALTTLALGGLIFLAMPRRTAMGTSKNSGTMGKHLTGFDDEVKLGELGEILENDSPVMSIELLNRNGTRVEVNEDTEYRWRGVTLDRYDRGRWFRPQHKARGSTLGGSNLLKNPPIIRQIIKLEPNDSPVLFGLRPILDVVTADQRASPELYGSDGTIFRTDPRSVTYDYVVESSASMADTQPSELYPGGDYRLRLVSIADGLKERLRAIALEKVKGIDAADIQGKAAALDAYLRESGEFRYSLQMSIEDPNLDPVEDFLLNRKAGHCEYFASALALLLRSVDIPSRVVNGFKGGDHNAVSGIITVRQKHAHSWVEALVGRAEDNNQSPIWLTLDPTPADQRNESVAKVGGIASNFYQITDLVRYVWIFYVVGFNSDRQNRFIYGPIRNLIQEARRGFGLIGDLIRSWLHFPSVESFFSLRGFAVSFLALLILVGLVRAMAWAIRRVVRKIQGPKVENPSGMAAIQFYRRLLQLLSGFGLERPPAETPREFARRAAVLLSGQGSGNEGVADVPPLVVDAYYQLRFGEHTIRDDDFRHVTARLDALEARLHPAKS